MIFPHRLHSALGGACVATVLRLAVLGALLASAGMVGSPAAAPVEASGVCSPSSRMAQARYEHTATLLADGAVLVSGGEASDLKRLPRLLASAEIYDPGRDAWSGAGSMALARRGHTATVLADGRVLVVGGMGPGGVVAAAELYDPVARAWSPASGPSTPRHGHTATRLGDGRVLVAGGVAVDATDAAGPLASLGSAEVYDPGASASGSGTWSAAGSMSRPRAFASATLLPDGRVLVLGGTGPTGSLTSADLYDPGSPANGSGTWSVAGGLEGARGGHTATLLPDGRVFVAGGLNFFFKADQPAASVVGQEPVELFDWQSGRSSEIARLAEPPSGHTATLLPDGSVLIVGGTHPPQAGVSGRTILYDPPSESLRDVDRLKEARASHTATLLPNGKVLVVGGFGRGRTLNSVELYEPAGGTWTVSGAACAPQAARAAGHTPG
jgi:hypothetical protein